MANTKDGCSFNNDTRSGGYELVSLSGEYAKHLSSVVLNNYNLLFGLSPTPFKFPLLIYYYYQLCYLYSCISEISKICDSDPKCKCNCNCVSECNENTICLCLCECTKGEKANVCCICICKKPDNCKCICICICKKAGNQCCCTEGQTHTCKEPLVKVDIGTLKEQTCRILFYLRWIRCFISRLENQTCQSTSNIRCCCCSCCSKGCTPESCDSNCCCREGKIKYSWIRSVTNSTESLFKQIGTKISQLSTMRNVLSPLLFISTKCVACPDCSCNKIEILIKHIERSLHYYSLFASRIDDIKNFVYYKMFYNKSNEIIDNLKMSINPLINQLSLVNNDLLRNLYYSRILHRSLTVIYSYHNILKCYVSLCKLSFYSSKIYTLLYIIRWTDHCLCVMSFKSNTYFKIFNFNKDYFKDKINVNDFKRLITNNEGNHKCLCLVIKYSLYPPLIKCLYYLRHIYLESLGKQTREFTRNVFNCLQIDQITNMFNMIEIIYKITIYIKPKIYLRSRKVFCEISNDKNYHLIVNTVLVISGMMENMWSMDTETIRMSIEKISTLMSEFYIMNNYDNKSKFKSINIKLLNPFKRCDTNTKIKEEINYYFKCIKESFKCMNTNGNDISKYEFSVQLSINNINASYNKTIYIQLEFTYPNNLMKMCAQSKCKDNELCECVVIQIYSLSILMSNINSKLKSKMNIINESVKTLEVMIIIVKEINNTSLSKIYLMKNNSNSYPESIGNYNGSKINVTDIMTVRNWGYDTHCEQVTALGNTNIISLFSIIFIGLLSIFTSIDTN